MAKKRKHIDVEDYGVYEEGMTDGEIRDYISDRCDGKNVQKWVDKFLDAAGPGNTMLLKDGIPLMYRYDVLRFANQVFSGKRTYFD